MIAKNCCKTMEMELTAWKAIVYDLSRKMEKSSTNKNVSISSYVGDLHILIEEMDERIENIRETCTPKMGMEDIQTERDKYDKALVNVRMKTDEAMRTLGAGDFGG